MFKYFSVFQSYCMSIQSHSTFLPISHNPETKDFTPMSLNTIWLPHTNITSIFRTYHTNFFHDLILLWHPPTVCNISYYQLYRPTSCHIFIGLLKSVTRDLVNCIYSRKIKSVMVDSVRKLVKYKVLHKSSRSSWFKMNQGKCQACWFSSLFLGLSWQVFFIRSPAHSRLIRQRCKAAAAGRGPALHDIERRRGGAGSYFIMAMQKSACPLPSCAPSTLLFKIAAAPLRRMTHLAALIRCVLLPLLCGADRGSDFFQACRRRRE